MNIGKFGHSFNEVKLDGKLAFKKEEIEDAIRGLIRDFPCDVYFEELTNDFYSADEVSSIFARLYNAFIERTEKAVAMENIVINLYYSFGTLEEKIAWETTRKRKDSRFMK